MLLSCLLLFEGNHILVICAQNVHQKLSFSGSKCKTFPALGGGGDHPLHRPSTRSVASLPRSGPSEVRGTRIFEPPENFLVTGLPPPPHVRQICIA